MAHVKASRAELVRGLGLWPAVAINVANMIGTGVFLKARVMTCNVGTPWLVIAVWIAAGLLTLAGTFSYAEVATMMPEAGGDYVYIRRAYGRLVGFLNGWMTFAIGRAAAQAALSVGFAIFLNVAIGGGLERDLFAVGALHVSWLTVIALTALWAVGLVNCVSVAAGGQTALLLTIVKVALVLCVALGAYALATGHFAHFGLEVGGARCEGVAASARGGLAGFGAAMLGALWAYDGWNNVAPLAEEVKDPERNLPRAFIGGLLLVAALYLFVNVAYFYVLTPFEIGNVPASSSVATEVVRRFVGPAATTFVAIALMVSSLGALHASVFAGARYPFAMAREGLFFRSLGTLSPKTLVPVRAIIAQTVWASLVALSGSYDTLTDAMIFVSWIFYGLGAGSVFVFRYTLPEAERPYRALGYPWVPLAFLGVTAWLIFNTFVAEPLLALAGVGAILSGLPFYLYWSRQLDRVTPR